MQATLAWEMEGRLVVVVHGPQNPSGLEWTRFVNASLARARGPEERVLVVSYGGAPDGAQRKELADALRTASPTVIMTSSVVLRSLGAAFAFFNRQLNVVGINDYEGAFSYLRLSAAETTVVRRLRQTLEARLELQRELRA